MFAIIGIGCRFPGHANSPDELWNLLCSGVDAITEVPPDRFDLNSLFHSDPAQPGKLYARWGGFADFIDGFDAAFFGISPREATRMDPQQRMLLEVSWEAMDDAGLIPEQLAGSKVGVFLGITGHDYSVLQMHPSRRRQIDAHSITGTTNSIAPNRVSYLFDFLGPSFAVDTACSSSLTAVHLACRSLQAGECRLALAAGVNLLLNPETFMAIGKASMLSPDGRCKAFDASANGYVRAEGAGVVILKPLDEACRDRDRIYAVVRASAINHDGRTSSLTFPGLDAQEAMLRQVLHEAGISAAEVQYLEAHGPGTQAGDPVEAAAVGRVFGEGRDPASPLIVGSVKTNIGHLEAGAGIAGLIKTALALHHRQIPPNLHFRTPNPAIPFEQFRVRVPVELEPWPAPKGRAKAGVNSFGFGGANAHVLLEEAPQTEVAEREPSAPGANLLVLSARSQEALQQRASQCAEWLRRPGAPVTPDVCFTAALHRTHHEFRLAATGGSNLALADRLEAFLQGESRSGLAWGRREKSALPRLAFVFPGMGPQRPGMGLELMGAEPAFRSGIEECDALVRSLGGWSLIDVLRGEYRFQDPNSVQVAQLSNFAVQVSLVALWRSWGIVPDAVIGHSAGEAAACYAAGVLDLGSALRVAFHRGRLLDRLSGSGRMLAAGLSPGAADRLIGSYGDRVAIAAVNSSVSVALSGEAEALEQIAATLAAQQIFHRFLPVAVPYHTPAVEAIRDELEASLADLSPGPPHVPIASTVSGAWAGPGDFGGPYWYRNTRQSVRFADAVDLLIESGCELFLELGPHPVLGVSISECLRHVARRGTPLASLRSGEGEREVMLRSLGALYATGRNVDWPAVFPEGGSRVSLPAYPWQRERLWIEPVTEGESEPEPAAGTARHPLLGRRLRSPRPAWEGNLGLQDLEFLKDHVVEGRSVFPAAGYVEMALAAGGELFPHDGLIVENLVFHSLLAPDGGRAPLVQLHCEEDGAFAVHSAPAGENHWTRHASGRLRARSSPPPAPVDLAALLHDCPTEVPVGEWYRSFDRLGLHYGERFRTVAELWQGDGEAVGRLAWPGENPPSDGYRVHPTLLDGALQVLRAAVEGGSPPPGAEGMFLPASIRRVEAYGRASGGLYGHARVCKRTGDSFEGDVELLGESGEVILSIQGFRCRVVKVHTERERDDCLYTFEWELAPRADSGPASRAALTETANIVREVEPLVRRLAEEPRFRNYYPEIEPRLNRIAAGYARSALAKLGWDFRRDADPADAASSLGVNPAHQRLFAHLAQAIGAIDADPLPPRTLANQALRDLPEWKDAIELAALCGEGLADVLGGRRKAHEILFVPAAAGALRRLYADCPAFLFYNRIIAGSIAAAVAGVPDSSTVRVLEIGAGTGGATSHILPALQRHSKSYLFTDISPVFLDRAREQFPGEPGLDFALLDIEKDPAAQRLPERQFDIIVAANVVHATRRLHTTLHHVRSLLAPEGLLVLLEVTRPPLWAETIFGLLEGWWRFEDFDLRPDHPYLSQRQWLNLLDETGFTDFTAIQEPFTDGESMQRVFLSRAPGTTGSGAAGSRSWLILSDARGAGAQLAAWLEQRGHRCVVAANLDEYRRLGRRDFDAVALLGSLDLPSCDTLPASALLDAAVRSCGDVVDFVREFAGQGKALPDIWLITAGAQQVGGETGAIRIVQSPLWGLGRVLMNEHTATRCRLVDLSSDCRPEEIEGLLEELGGNDTEEEIAFRGDARYIRRVRRLPAESGNPGAGQPVAASQVRLRIDTTGALDTLRLHEVAPPEPGPEELVIRVRAAGLNFRDVMVAAGLIVPPEASALIDRAITFGYECAGVVEKCGPNVTMCRPGDEVIALSAGAIASHALTRQELAVSKPASLSFEEAGSIPLVFATAHYGLNHLARMQAGERVLIHAATGGVGLAAIQLCRRAGAEIFATAGSPEKRAYLKSLGIAHVMDSRSLDFAGEILDITHGEGVDIVLNSLTGEAIPKGLSVLRSHGRFLEIGKKDILENSQLGLFAFRKNLAFFGIDLEKVYFGRPSLAGALLREIARYFEEGALQALPCTTYDLASAESAFRLMAQAKHIGKIVLTMSGREYSAVPARARGLFREDATYLLTGGLGGFALATAQWMVERGARHLVLLGRGSVPAPENEQAFQTLLQTRASVRVIRGDVACEEDVARALEEIRRTMPPLRGVFHAAMVLEDKMLVHLGRDELRAVLAPKIAGAWNLHRLTLGEELDYFFLYSSGSAMFGNPRQGNYAAANEFLDLLARHRRAMGLPALSVSWGRLSRIGYVAHHEEAARFLDRAGVVAAITPEEAVAVMERLLGGGPAHVLAARVHWQKYGEFRGGRPPRRFSALLEEGGEEQALSRSAGDDFVAARLGGLRPEERRAAIEEHLAQRVARILAAPVSRVEPERPLIELGLDSLMAVELQSALKRDFGLQVPVTQLLEGISIRRLAGQTIAQLAPAEGTGDSAAPALQTVELPLGLEQGRFWFLDRMDPASPAYNVASALRLSGHLDVGAMESALGELLRRHDALRATFAAGDGTPVQRIGPPAPFTLPVIDLSGVAPAERDAELQRLAVEEARRPFDLSAGPVLRATLFKLDEREHILLFNVHHIVVDAWSLSLIRGQGAALYAAFSRRESPPLPSPALRYPAVLLRQQREWTREQEERQLSCWKNRLAGVEPLELPTDFPRPARRTLRGARRHFEIPESLTASLEALSRSEGATPFMTLLAAFQTLLHRYSASDDFCVGTPVASRLRAEAKDVVGCFVNTLAIRTRFQGDPSFRRLLAQVRETVLEAYDHSDVPFERVVEAVGPTRDPSQTPLFQVLFVLHNISSPAVELPGLAMTEFELDSRTTPFDLVLVMSTEGGLAASLEYNADLFAPETIDRMIGHFRTLLESIVALPDEAVSRLPLLTGPELREIVAGWNETGDPPECCLHQLFESQANRTPDAVAVCGGDESLTYREIDRAANRLASYLRQQGVGPEALVAICLERSLDAVVALIGILKAGGAFVPFDPAYPPERLRFLLEDARPRVVLTPETLHRDRDAIAREPECEPGGGATPRNLAYVLYTSGSTGRPKGVLIEHRGISNQLLWRQSAFPLSTADAVLQTTSLSFDPSVWEIFGPLAAGARVVLAPPGLRHDPFQVAGLIRRHQVSTLQVVPSALRSLVEENAFADCPSLQRVFCGGEALPAALRDRFLSSTDASLHNLYGATETSIDATCWTCARQDRRSVVPIGHPIANAQAYVLDGSLRPVPAGVPGELCIGGAGLARGYLNAAELTARSFVENRFQGRPGTRLYRTGDRARRLADGTIEYLGRLDRQLKVRGHRIEPGEIEAVLRQSPAVRDAAVAGYADEHGDLVLAAWIVPASVELRESELREFLAGKLPAYMAPGVYSFVDALPLTPDGKIDLGALPPPGVPCTGRTFVTPRNSTERQLAQLWEELLGVEPVGVTDNLFELGGHSLLAVRLVAAIRARLGAELAVADLFERPTIEQLAPVVRVKGP